MPTSPDAAAPLLELRDLRTVFPLAHGRVLNAVDGVSFTLEAGRTLCIVGESGSGKSITARSIMQIVGPPGRIVGGEIMYRPDPARAAVDIARLHPRGSAMRAIRGRDIAMFFQEPMTSLSPIHRIGWRTERQRISGRSSCCARWRSRIPKLPSIVIRSSSAAACASAR